MQTPVASVQPLASQAPIGHIWAKTGDADSWHPLVLHCLDVAAAAGSLLEREPEESRRQIARAIGLPWTEARPWLLLLVAAHDLGKASPGFQCKWRNLTGLRTSRDPDTSVNHAYISQLSLVPWLVVRGWSPLLAERAADAVGCHHGERASAVTLERLQANRGALGDAPWHELRTQVLGVLADVLQPGLPPTKSDMSGPEFMLLAGLTSFADWIGSNTEWFTFGQPAAQDDPAQWFAARQSCARQALDSLHWAHRTPLLRGATPFEQAIGFNPRPLQEAVAIAVSDARQPPILLIEAPMGEGKTEAAWYAHLELQRRFGHRGLYIAMPTQATGNAMFDRTLNFLRARGTDRVLDLQLVHGGSSLNDAFHALRLAPLYDEDAGRNADTDARVRAGEWFTHKKRALLSEYGVGTVDQALLPILPVRHHFVRLWGLANRTIVFDEIHAYDAYTGTLLLHLVHWLHALGSSVILLSATLPPAFRRELARMVGATQTIEETPYPRLSTFQSGQVRQHHFSADPARRQTLRVQAIGADLAELRDAVWDRLSGGGMGLVLVNTVQRAQELYSLLPEGEPLLEQDEPVGKRLADGTEVYLFHARYPAYRRQRREQRALAVFGKPVEGAAPRTGRKVLIATQVAEQSLDLDFDLIATDLAPIDLLLQRAGRLWRHHRAQRPLSEPLLLVAGLEGDAPVDFGRPLWWNKVYAEARLLQTWCLLRLEANGVCTLPDDIDSWVSKVYEDEVAIPDALLERFERSLIQAEGDAHARKGLAHNEIIGLPDDASWADNPRALYDEDDPMVHRTLAAQTRLGEDSLTVIPLWPTDMHDPRTVPSPAQAKAWCARALRVARKSVVHQLKQQGLLETWQQSPWLRNSFPLCLNEQDEWTEDATVRLDAQLGLVYAATHSTKAES
jgi:CRISPR-associated endonuclease/helicase Cas3